MRQYLKQLLVGISASVSITAAMASNVDVTLDFAADGYTFWEYSYGSTILYATYRFPDGRPPVDFVSYEGMGDPDTFPPNLRVNDLGASLWLPADATGSVGAHGGAAQFHTLAPGDTLTLTARLQGSYTLDHDGSVWINGGSSIASPNPYQLHDLLSFDQAFTGDFGTFDLTNTITLSNESDDFALYSLSFYFNTDIAGESRPVLSPVPEPATYASMLVALGLMIPVMARRRRLARPDHS